MAGNRQLSMDLLLVVGFVLITNIFILVPVLSDSFLRTYLGIILVLFLPGYALTVALFPAKKDLDGIERTAISFGLSISIAPLLGLGLNYSSWGIREIPLLTEFSIFTLLICAVAHYRRGLLPETEVFGVSFKRCYLSMKARVFEKPESKTDKVIAFILALSILASMGSLVYIIGNSKEGEHFTEFYILGNNSTIGDYPTEFVPGEKGTVIVGVINHEYRPMDYTIDVRLENRLLLESKKQISLEHNMSWEKPVTFTPPLEGKNMKLEFLLFNESEKTTPYRNLHLWINVTEEA
ncbi:MULTISPECIES: DUF1616 domain-containing protein [Methanosarcina]|uniref:DUF1616 domain-containing protein n=3 Tax=Methanosarcina barkeri TaxID=2208 RepID=A0A0E3QXM3_METBA|nr:MULTISPECIES: DUF1616 domain-containing protein [Methanosarcina]AKB56408.1 hypothetical protein MSBRM_3410 [Methanosarcina barkeri MS]AKB59883.1 hypothetical protein MSBR2_3367 [Methanosarcina barkeri 227]AKJ40536.1 hypothetical protein MCM1_3553 [Methanosarcina barkeri CM1]OEC91324.1 hypothetical protein A9239_03290 [Methanosarcina sp. A14]